MARFSDTDVELEPGKSVLAAASHKHIERLLKRAADHAAKLDKRNWTGGGRDPFKKPPMATGAFEGVFRKALFGALTYHSNNSGKRPSIRLTAPDTGGRPLHFDHTPVSTQTIKLKPRETAPAGSTYGKRKHARKKYHTTKTAAHMIYLERDGTLETFDLDLEAAAKLRAERPAARSTQEACRSTLRIRPRMRR